MVNSINSIGMAESIGQTQSGSMLAPAFETMRNHEERLHNKISDGLTADLPNRQFKEFLNQTFDRLQTKFTSPIEQQTFNLVREQALASQESNVQHIQDRIRSRLSNVQLELSMKAAGKTSQGLQQLLSSQ